MSISSKSYKLSEVKKILNVSYITVRNMIKRGDLKAFIIGVGPRNKTWRVAEQDLKDFMDRNMFDPLAQNPVPVKEDIMEVLPDMPVQEKHQPEVIPEQPEEPKINPGTLEEPPL